MTHVGWFVQDSGNRLWPEVELVVHLNVLAVGRRASSESSDTGIRTHLRLKAVCGRQDVLGVDQSAAAVELLDLAELEEDSGHPK